MVNNFSDQNFRGTSLACLIVSKKKKNNKKIVLHTFREHQEYNLRFLTTPTMILQPLNCLCEQCEVKIKFTMFLLLEKGQTAD